MDQKSIAMFGCSVKSFGQYTGIRIRSILHRRVFVMTWTRTTVPPDRHALLAEAPPREVISL